MAINLDHQLNKIYTSTSDINFDITGSVKLPVGTTAQRTGTLTGGELRFNSSLNIFEGYNGTDWLSLGALEDNTIDSLSDVDLTGIQSGQVLKWNGTTFVAADDTDTTLVLANQSVGDLGDVDTTTTAPTDGQVLKWNASQSKWLPADDLQGSGTGGGIDEGDAIAFAIALGS
jgi:hypothetical protein